MNENLLLLHGALGSKEQFLPLINLLNDNFNIHCFNFDGHGGLNSDNAFSIDLFAMNIQEYIKENKIEGTNVFGYSMGGYSAMKLASTKTSIFNKIMTLGTKFLWTEASAEKEIKLLNPEIIEMKVPQFANDLKKRHQPNDWKIVVKKTADLLYELGNGKAMNNSDFQKIHNEVLVSLGSNDKMATQEESELTVNKLPNGKLLILENTPHPIEMVNIELLSSTILDFMK